MQCLGTLRAPHSGNFSKIIGVDSLRAPDRRLSIGGDVHKPTPAVEDHPTVLPYHYDLFQHPLLSCFVGSVNRMCKISNVCLRHLDSQCDTLRISNHVSATLGVDAAAEGLQRRASLNDHVADFQFVFTFR